jgi:hypothetical protein
MDLKIVLQKKNVFSNKKAENTKINRPKGKETTEKEKKSVKAGKKYPLPKFPLAN